MKEKKENEKMSLEDHQQKYFMGFTEGLFVQKWENYRYELSP